jgi:hypothetical protein
MNNNQIRIVNEAGRYNLRWVSLDEEGQVDKVLLAEVKTSFRNLDEMRQLFKNLNLASSLPVVVVNASNSRLLKQMDMEQ